MQNSKKITSNTDHKKRNTFISASFHEKLHASFSSLSYSQIKSDAIFHLSIALRHLYFSLITEKSEESVDNTKVHDIF